MPAFAPPFPTTPPLVYDANGTDYELHKATLRAGELLEYVEGVGFFIIQGSTWPALRTVKLGSDFTNSTTTAAEVTGLSATTGVGTFLFEYLLIHQAAAATTGFKASVNHTGTVSSHVYWVLLASATTTASDGAQDQDIVLTTGGLLNVNAA